MKNKKMKQLILLLTCLLLGTISFSQVGIGTEEPDASAILDLNSTTQGLLPPRMTDDDRNNISTPPAGLTVWCANCGANGEMQVYNGDAWVNLMGGDAAPPVIISATGKIWMDRNLGANQVATSSTDAASYGDLYQWGRNSDGHEDRNSSTTSGPVSAGSEGSDFINASSDWLITQDDFRWGDPTEADKGGQDPCPNGYRVPTQSEWQAEINEGNWSNATDAFASPLKLPEAGFRANTTISLFDEIQYWSSSVSGNDAVYLSTYNGMPANLVAGPRFLGLSVRCIKD